VPAPWKNWSFSEQAESIIEMFDGLTEDDLELIYLEWEQGDYIDHPAGRTEALAELQMIAQRRYLEKCGKGDAHDKLFEAWLRGQK